MAKPISHPESESKRHKFLAALREGLTVTKAAERVGENRSNFYYWRDQSAAFARDWDDAIAMSNEVLLDEVRERALDRKDPRSYLLLMFLVKSKFPEFKEAYKPPVEQKREEMQEFDFTVEDIQKAKQILDDAQTRVSDG